MIGWRAAKYDELTLPETQLTRTGYTFAGWHVRSQYDFSTLSWKQPATEAYGIGKNGYRICYGENGAGEGGVNLCPSVCAGRCARWATLLNNYNNNNAWKTWLQHLFESGNQ